MLKNNRNYNIITFEPTNQSNYIMPIIQNASTKKEIYNKNKNSKNICNFPEYQKKQNYLYTSNSNLDQLYSNIKKKSLLNPLSTNYDFINFKLNNNKNFKESIYNRKNLAHKLIGIGKFEDKSRLYAPKFLEQYNNVKNNPYGFKKLKGLCARQIDKNNFKDDIRFTTKKKFFVKNKF